MRLKNTDITDPESSNQINHNITTNPIPELVTSSYFNQPTCLVIAA